MGERRRAAWGELAGDQDGEEGVAGQHGVAWVSWGTNRAVRASQERWEEKQRVMVVGMGGGVALPRSQANSRLGEVGQIVASWRWVALSLLTAHLLAAWAGHASDVTSGIGPVLGRKGGT